MIRPCTYYSLRKNLFLTSKKNLAKSVLETLTDSSGISFLTSTTFCAFIFASVLSAPSMYTNINLQKTTRVVLKLFVKG